MASLATYMVLTTPALLESLGLESVTAASEEWAARVLLLGNLVGVNSLVGAGVDFELLSNSLTFECRNPQLSAYI